MKLSKWVLVVGVAGSLLGPTWTHAASKHTKDAEVSIFDPEWQELQDRKARERALKQAEEPAPEPSPAEETTGAEQQTASAEMPAQQELTSQPETEKPKAKPQPKPLVAKQVKIAAPEGARLSEAMHQVHVTYSEEFAKISESPMRKRFLAQQLIRDAEAPGLEPAVRFAMLRWAVDLSADIWDSARTNQAIQLIERNFVVNGPALRVAAYADLMDDAPAKDLPGIVKNAIRELRAQIHAERFATAENLLNITDAAFRRSPAGSLEDVKDDLVEVRQIMAEYNRASFALNTISSDPQSPAKNYVAGRFYCLILNEWKKGLPMLVKGSEKMYAGIAQLELQPHRSTEETMKLADMWWQQAQQNVGVIKTRQQERAARWYRDVIPHLTGLEKVRAQKRIDGSNESVSSLEPTSRRSFADVR